MNDLIHEYTEANNYLRHYSQLRFVMFTVYFAVTAGVLTISFSVFNVQLNSLVITMMIRSVGLLTTLVFGVYELRLEQLIRYYQKSAIPLEKKLGYTLMEKRPANNWIFRATKFLYAVLFVFWVLLIIITPFIH